MFSKTLIFIFHDLHVSLILILTLSVLITETCIEQKCEHKGKLIDRQEISINI